MSELKLTEYVCHKRVRAAKIIGIEDNPCVPHYTLLLDDPHETAPMEKEVDAKWLDKHQPTVGGYFVVYADGYESYSPQAAFEEGYTAVDQPLNIPLGKSIA